jgi:hypothetical protein
MASLALSNRRLVRSGLGSRRLIASGVFAGGALFERRKLLASG